MLFRQKLMVGGLRLKSLFCLPSLVWEMKKKKRKIWLPREEYCFSKRAQILPVRDEAVSASQTGSSRYDVASDNQLLYISGGAWTPPPPEEAHTWKDCKMEVEDIVHGIVPLPGKKQVHCNTSRQLKICDVSPRGKKWWKSGLRISALHVRKICIGNKSTWDSQNLRCNYSKRVNALDMWHRSKSQYENILLLENICTALGKQWQSFCCPKDCYLCVGKA